MLEFPQHSSSNSATHFFTMPSTVVIALLSALSITSYAHAVDNSYVHPPNGNCKDYTVRETVTSENLIWGLPKLKDNFEAVGLAFNISIAQVSGEFVPFTGAENVT